jgi:hypothetical protein
MLLRRLEKPLLMTYRFLLENGGIYVGCEIFFDGEG